MSQPITIGKYEILDNLGRGGFATVYQARDTTLDRIVALKVLHVHVAEDQVFVHRFEQEARTAARFDHSHIITIYEVGEEAGQHYIAMKYLPGRGLDRWLEKAGGPLPLEQIVSIVDQVAGALDYIHHRRSVHRDVKPANVMLNDDGHATLLDFGIVRAADGTPLTTIGEKMGTPQYMSPEQAEGREIDHRSDVYALGVMAYQMCTGQAPFDNASPLVLLRLHADKAPPPPHELNPHLPDPVTRTLLKALSKKPVGRYQSAGGFAAALRQAVQDAAHLAERYDKLKTTRAPIPAWVWPVGALLGLAMLIILGKLAFGPAPSPTPTSTKMPTNTPDVIATIVIPSATAIAVVPPSATPTNTPTPSPEPPSGQPPATASLHDTWVRPADGMTMVYVPGGTFQMGSDEDNSDADSDEFPQHSVTLDAFWIDQTEVSVAQFHKFVSETGYETKAERDGQGYAWTGDTGWDWVDGADWQHPQRPDDNAQDDHPVVQVSWTDAVAYCTWAGAQLPTEAQWEYVVKGSQGNIYPWGNEFDCSRSNFDDETELDSYVVPGGEGCDGYVRTAPVGSFPDGDSWCDALDIAGNVWEWTADWYGDYDLEAQTNPTGLANGSYKVLRGGSFDNVQRGARASDRISNSFAYRSVNVGFRCVNAVPGQ